MRFLEYTQWRATVGLLWTSDQPVAEISTWQHTTLTTNIHAPGEIRTHDLSRRAAAELRLRPRGHWDRHGGGGGGGGGGDDDDDDDDDDETDKLVT